MGARFSYHMKCIKMQIAFFTLLFFVSSCYAQYDSHFYKDSSYSCKYQTLSGMLFGNYVSYYHNGVKKSEGNFQFNNRIGEWSVWDSTGKLRVKRVYSNPYEYTRIYPKIPSEGPIPLLSKPIYTLRRDSLDECIPYTLQARMVFYQQRNFKCFYTSDTQAFFDCKMLFDILYEHALKKEYSIYGSKKGDEDDYSIPLNILNIDTSKITLVGFRIKSDIHFDDTRFIFDERPLWIAALVTYKTNPNDKADNFTSKDTFDLFQVNVPQVRKFLTQVKHSFTFKNRPTFIQNLDDVFLFGCFSYRKYRHSTVFDDKRIVYTQTAESSLIKGTLSEVETENDLWLLFNK